MISRSFCFLLFLLTIVGQANKGGGLSGRFGPSAFSLGPPTSLPCSVSVGPALKLTPRPPFPTPSMAAAGLPLQVIAVEHEGTPAGQGLFRPCVDCGRRTGGVLRRDNANRPLLQGVHRNRNALFRPHQSPKRSMAARPIHPPVPPLRGPVGAMPLLQGLALGPASGARSPALLSPPQSRPGRRRSHRLVAPLTRSGSASAEPPASK